CPRPFTSCSCCGIFLLEGDSFCAMKPWARKFYQSREWKRTREVYIRLRHGLCERGGAGGKIVHHKIYLTPQNINDPTVTLNFDNLELLCQECHNREHHMQDPVADGLRFTEDGDLVGAPMRPSDIKTYQDGPPRGEPQVDRLID